MSLVHKLCKIICVHDVIMTGEKGNTIMSFTSEVLGTSLTMVVMTDNIQHKVFWKTKLCWCRLQASLATALLCIHLECVPFTNKKSVTKCDRDRGSTNFPQLLYFSYSRHRRYIYLAFVLVSHKTSSRNLHMNCPHH